MSEGQSARGRRFAVLRCEDAEKWDDKSGLFAELLGRPEDDSWSLYVACRGEFPDRHADYDGYVVSGSHYSCTDPELEWVPELEQLIRDCIERETPIVGLCFGAQVMAQALGGRVGANPHGRFTIGLEQVELLPAFADLASEPAPPDRPLRLLQSHADSVLELPDGAEALARSETAAYEMFRYGSALAIQGHPELLPDELDERILTYVEADGRVSAVEADAARESLRTAPDSDYVLRLLRRFLEG